MGKHTAGNMNDGGTSWFGGRMHYPDGPSDDMFGDDGQWASWDDDEDFYADEDRDEGMDEDAGEEAEAEAMGAAPESVADSVRDALQNLFAIRKAREEREQAEREREKERQEREERARRIEEYAREAERREAEAARLQAITEMEVPLDFVNLYATDARAEGVQADGPSDGLMLSLANLGRVDIEYIAQITGEGCKTVIEGLRGSIYQNPETWDECFYKGWETADEYLSGNLVRKLKAAREANEKYAGLFARNMDALESVMPERLSKGDIYVTLGSPWVPEDIIADFIEYLLGNPPVGRREDRCGVRRDEYTGAWEITNKWMYYGFGNRVKLHDTYGTQMISALDLIERSLNMRSAAVYDTVRSDRNKSGQATVLNKTETVAAMEKQKLIASRFSAWVWKNKKRAARLAEIYESQYACMRRRVFDGSFLKFPGMAEGVSLYKYQKDAVARIIFTPNTLLAHEVGAGKTYIMAAAGMEMKRMGLSEKNMYVVPNNILGQWEEMFRGIYPKARLLVASPKDFTPAKKHDTMLKIRDEDHDAIIIPYSSFTKIPVSLDYAIEDCTEELEKMEAVDPDKATQRLRYRQTMLRKKLKKLEEDRASGKQADEICFDELGVTRLFIDEAHNFKNLPIDTNVDRVLGISPSGSKKCEDMYRKVCMVQKRNAGGGVVMATGTPITNSVTDVFVMQKYLQGGELALLDLQNFDSWVAMFGEKVTDFEIDVDTSGYRLATRFASFHNLPELTSLLASIADFHRMDSGDGVPETDGYTDCLIRKTPEFDEFLQGVSARADKVRAGGVDRHKDNMLKITTDGRQAALDLRLVKPDASGAGLSKVAECAENVYSVYLKSADVCGTQLVFCDTSTPKDKFNIYDELRRLLVDKGIPKQEIAYIHDAQTEKYRAALFENMRNGHIRVLIGSTFKMGLGMNVQDRLIAIHHIDIPWRPADMVQREGRILRPGNTNKKVYIFRYITEGSFDAYSWQLLETKQRFISDLLSGSYSERSGGDIKDAVLDYAEVKALAVGNPLLKERVKTANELSRLLTLKRKDMEDRMRMVQIQNELPDRISETERRAAECGEDLLWHRSLKAQNADLEQWRKERQEKARRFSVKPAGADAAAAAAGNAPAGTTATEGISNAAEADAATAEAAAGTATEMPADGSLSVLADAEAAAYGAAYGAEAAEDEPADAEDGPVDEEDAAADTDEESPELPAEEAATDEEKARNAAFREREKKLLAERKSVREQLYAAVSAYDCSSRETYVCDYMGFGIYIPAGMSILNPYIWLKRTGRYDVELGQKDKGYLTRIDNVLDALDTRQQKLISKAAEYKKTLGELGKELATDSGFDERIASVKKALAGIDKKLGIEES